ncbi:hypothetical protein OBBRIDRAFT_486806 [Obba rivulosa]|uniref:Uncharacterized protein n=1 Tax=Obba rivulosa TaxID=1052685 RepID=A0A8E2AL23_9APHY|nr:hypothetical protein OBBRIDRAFT_486806 [Obba rivulosa]
MTSKPVDALCSSPSSSPSPKPSRLSSSETFPFLCSRHFVSRHYERSGLDSLVVARAFRLGVPLHARSPYFATAPHLSRVLRHSFHQLQLGAFRESWCKSFTSRETSRCFNMTLLVQVVEERSRRRRASPLVSCSLISDSGLPSAPRTMRCLSSVRIHLILAGAARYKSCRPHTLPQEHLLPLSAARPGPARILGHHG